MPFYQLSVILRPLAKVELVEALKTCCSRMIEEGAVVTKVESIGYRDLPYKMKPPGQPRQITGSFVVFDFYSPTVGVTKLMPFFKQNVEFVHYYFYKPPPAQPVEECSLYEELKPPAYRKSVEELRKNKRMDRLSREIAMLNARQRAKLEPKSYHIAPFRE